MARTATIIRKIADAFGDPWDAREDRPTQHGWPLWLGWPSGVPRGKGGVGGPRVIITDSLLHYLEEHRTARGVDLPVGSGAIKRLWRIIGRDYYGEVAEWWAARAEDLASLTLDAFARKHAVTESAAEMWRLRLFGKRLREAGWWHQEPAKSLLESNVARAFVADSLGISIGAVGRLRWCLRMENTCGTQTD
ncbi:MAG: hypothetical protein LLG00_11645 [Planctomycetaceae bacterium]|nr:hypothetical protein [Planctomycetaceae bacterium]